MNFVFRIIALLWLHCRIFLSLAVPQTGSSNEVRESENEFLQRINTGTTSIVKHNQTSFPKRNDDAYE